MKDPMKIELLARIMTHNGALSIPDAEILQAFAQPAMSPELADLAEFADSDLKTTAPAKITGAMMTTIIREVKEWAADNALECYPPPPNRAGTAWIFVAPYAK